MARRRVAPAAAHPPPPGAPTLAHRIAAERVAGRALQPCSLCCIEPTASCTHEKWHRRRKIAQLVLNIYCGRPWLCGRVAEAGRYHAGTRYQRREHGPAVPAGV